MFWYRWILKRLGLAKRSSCPPEPALRALPAYSWQESGLPRPTLRQLNAPRPLPVLPGVTWKAPDGSASNLVRVANAGPLGTGVLPTRPAGTPPPPPSGEKGLPIEAKDIVSEEPSVPYDEDELTIVQVNPGFDLLELFPGDR